MFGTQLNCITEIMTRKMLFMCLGNMCRSPIAEAVFIHELKQAGEESEWQIDSAAIEPWYIGRNPDQRAMAAIRKHNLSYNNRTRIHLKPSDFMKYDYIFCMDDKNIHLLQELCPENAKAKLMLLGDFDPDGERIIRDPYHDRDVDGFEKTYQQSIRSCDAFVAHLKQNHGWAIVSDFQE